MNSSGPILHTVGLSGTSGEFTDIVTISKGTAFTVSRALRGGKFWTLKTCTHPDTASLQMLRREYEISRNLRHPFILNAISLEDTPAGEAIVTEYVEGRTLAEYLAERPSARDRRKVFGQILDAVTYLHRKSVTHNDLKAENILVSSVGDNVVLIDFGMAESSAHHLTHHLGGTAGTSAPEVLDGNPDAKTDARTDIYSLGILLNRMFGASGRTYQHYGAPVGPVHCTGKYRRTIRKSTSHDPAGRPASADEFHASMERDERRPAILACIAALVALCAVAATLLTAGHQGGPLTQEQEAECSEDPMLEEIRITLGRFAKESLDSLNNPAIAPWQEYGYNILKRSTAKYLAYKFTLPDSLHFACDTIGTRLIVIPLNTALCRQTTLYDAEQSGLISHKEYCFHLNNANSGGFFRPFPGKK